MNYIERNKMNRNHIKGCCHVSERFEWEDREILKILVGELPEIRDSFYDDVREKYDLLRKEYSKYDFFNTEPSSFLDTIKGIIDEIQTVKQYWSGVNFSSIEEAVLRHKFCLISGEGGIGKSYFVKCLEEELENRNINHMCLYGKYEKNISDINFDEICNIGATETFVFAFDAINELDEVNQQALILELEKIKKIKGMRIIVTYRNGAVEENILKRYSSISESEYHFPGISFESAVEWLSKSDIEDVSEYLDILYTNSPFLLEKLPLIMDRHERNNVSRYTHIYEQYIVRSIDKMTWEQTKAVTRFMYSNNTKVISAEEIASVVDSPVEYLSNMEQKGFLNRHINKGKYCYSFAVESLADYLLVRHLWDAIAHKEDDECAEIIKRKVKEFYSIEEAVILMLFDKFAPNYKRIKSLLTKCKLIERFSYDVLQKIHFGSMDAREFLKVFKTENRAELLAYFGGYKNKPFNCTNFLNNYYLEDTSRQTNELSRVLSRRFVDGKLKIRLKNMLYFVCKCDCSINELLEKFYTALWCSSAGNQDIRNISIKLMFEAAQRNEQITHELIKIYPKIEDYYIQEAIIYVLSYCRQSEKIKVFFKSVLQDKNFLLAKSIRRMETYIDNKYGWINLEKENLCFKDDTKISEDFATMLSAIDLHEKYLLPFRFWSAEHVDLHGDFILVDKHEIADFNNKLNNDFSCVKEGICNGSMIFNKKAEKVYSVSYHDSNMGSMKILTSLESVLRSVFRKYELSFNYKEIWKKTTENFSTSEFRKCVCIAIDILYGSLMCNYFTDTFGTYNNNQNSVGYEVFDPLEDGEEMYITTPVPVFQHDIEKMGDFLLKKIDVSPDKNEKWWGDLHLTRKNVLNLLTPIKYKGHEWCVLAARISAKDHPEDANWEDTYDVFCCTSDKETLRGDGEERYLTIELEEYCQNIYDYSFYQNKPWLCKRVPSILYESNCFDDVNFFLPPAELVSLLKLKLDINEMCWCDDNDNKIIICNNNKSSYFRDYVIGTVMIRKDVLDKVREKVNIKYFVFSERFIKEKGYSPDTACHFEIDDGEIIKSVLNYGNKHSGKKESIPDYCKNCRHGMYAKTEPLDIKLFNIIKEYGR